MSFVDGGLAPLVPVEVDPETPVPVVLFRLPAAVAPSLLGLPLRLVAALAALPLAAGMACERTQPPFRTAVPCIRQPVIVTRCAALLVLVRLDWSFRRSVPVVCDDVSLDPLLVEGADFV